MTAVGDTRSRGEKRLLLVRCEHPGGGCACNAEALAVLLARWDPPRPADPPAPPPPRGRVPIRRTPVLAQPYRRPPPEVTIAAPRRRRGLPGVLGPRTVLAVCALYLLVAALRWVLP